MCKAYDPEYGFTHHTRTYLDQYSNSADSATKQGGQRLSLRTPLVRLYFHKHLPTTTKHDTMCRVYPRATHMCILITPSVGTPPPNPSTAPSLTCCIRPCLAARRNSTLATTARFRAAVQCKPTSEPFFARAPPSSAQVDAQPHHLRISIAISHQHSNSSHFCACS